MLYPEKLQLTFPLAGSTSLTTASTWSESQLSISSSVKNNYLSMWPLVKLKLCTITKNEALNCCICNVWLHRLLLRWGTKESIFPHRIILRLYSLLPGLPTVSELKNEIASLRVEVVVIKDELNLANKKLDAVATRPTTQAGNAKFQHWQ